MKRGVRGVFGVLAALALVAALPAPASAAPYRFTKVADSLSDGFHPFSFECSSISGIFVGPRASADRVIATGDTLDGATVQSLSFCEEGLNDADQLAFTATFADTTAPFDTRVAVFRATPRR